MHIEPIIPDFDFVKIRRSGGFVGVDETLQVDRNFAASVTDRMSGDRTFELDAFTSQELMHALARLAQVKPEPSSHNGFDMFHYDVELSIGGNLQAFHSVDVGADEALHGVMLAANRLVHDDPNPFHTMTLHVQPVTA
ncbi:MAG: hypothetical protein JWL76_1223 [Thermoleophilia bacterium]|nr:hypothetical protein [Thermoleophilia bacterium]